MDPVYGRGRRQGCSAQRAAALLAVALAVAAGAGCARTPEEPPAIVWVDGEPDGPLEDDPWVRTVRAGEAVFTHAGNTGDFSSPELVESWDYAQISSLASRMRLQLRSRRPRVELGPQPFAPLIVREEDDGRRALVIGCADAPQWFPVYDDGNRWPQALEYLVELEDDGRRRIIGASGPLDPVVLEDGTEVTPEFCDTVRIPRAVFDPPPDPDDLARLRARKVTPPPSPTPGS